MGDGSNQRDFGRGRGKVPGLSDGKAWGASLKPALTFLARAPYRMHVNVKFYVKAPDTSTVAIGPAQASAHTHIHTYTYVHTYYTNGEVLVRIVVDSCP